MPRTKQLNIVVTYGGTPYVVNDLGEGKSPRFEFYDTEFKKIIQKSNNPTDFDKWLKANVKGWENINV